MPDIVSTNYGKDRGVLSWGHVEYDPFLLDEHDPYIYPPPFLHYLVYYEIHSDACEAVTR